MIVVVVVVAACVTVLLGVYSELDETSEPEFRWYLGQDSLLCGQIELYRFDSRSELTSDDDNPGQRPGRGSCEDFRF